jgi:hypothetical protein
MKKLIFVAFALIFVSSVNAQLLRSIANSATNHAKNAAENKAIEKADDEAEKGVNKLFDNLTKKDSTKKAAQEKPAPNSGEQGGKDQPPQGMSNFMKSMGMNTEEVKHKEVYKFSSEITMVIQATDAKGKKQDPAEYVSRFDETSSDASFVLGNKEGSTTTTIMDTENKCMLILTESDGKKTGIASKIDPGTTKPAAEEKQGTAQKPIEECKFSKTGKTQSISGYSCSEYSCETSEAISIAWTTKDFSANNNKIFGSSATGKAYKTEGLDGMVIQYETHSKTDKSSSIMTIKSIDMKKSSSFSTVGYEISSFSFTPKN